jgi:hypothetical protein
MRFTPLTRSAERPVKMELHATDNLHVQHKDLSLVSYTLPALPRSAERPVKMELHATDAATFSRDLFGFSYTLLLKLLRSAERPVRTELYATADTATFGRETCRDGVARCY